MNNTTVIVNYIGLQDRPGAHGEGRKIKVPISQEQLLAEKDG